MVYSDTSGTVKLARADAQGTKDAFGVVSDASINNGASGNIATAGVLVATTGQWDAVTGGSSGLTTNEIYYLSAATAGALTTTAPGTGWVVPIGYALSTTRMKLIFGPTVRN